MQAFDLKWPKTTVTLFSNGWRCRIVWRTDRGMGGVIENNEQCKRRIADSLPGAPELLGQLRRAGFEELATEIESLAGDSVAEPPAVAPRTKAAEQPSEKKVIADWLGSLAGVATWAKAETHKARKWYQLQAGATDAADAQEFHLKAPLKKGPKQWVLRRRWPNAERAAKPEFFVAEDFKGICECLLSFHDQDGAEILSAALAGCAKLAKDFDEVQAAIESWQTARDAL